eukprot:648501-Pyramimonas_sp.AAC.1
MSSRLHMRIMFVRLAAQSRKGLSGDLLAAGGDGKGGAAPSAGIVPAPAPCAPVGAAAAIVQFLEMVSTMCERLRRWPWQVAAKQPRCFCCLRTLGADIPAGLSLDA